MASHETWAWCVECRRWYYLEKDAEADWSCPVCAQHPAEVVEEH